jgi:hypothetical protein
VSAGEASLALANILSNILICRQIKPVSGRSRKREVFRLREWIGITTVHAEAFKCLCRSQIT